MSLADAPADVCELIGFLNTLHVADGVDVLAGSVPAQWREEGSGAVVPSSLAGRSAGRGDAATERLRLAREAIRQLTRDRSGTESPPLQPGAGIIGSVPLLAVIGAGEPLVRLVAGHTVDPADRQVADVVATLVTAALAGHLARLKTCAAPNCRWAFWDATKNRSRRWCAMSRCGNRANVEAFRARNAAQR